MISNPLQSDRLPSTPVGTWEAVREFGGAPFQSTPPPRSPSPSLSTSSTSSYTIVSRSEPLPPSSSHPNLSTNLPTLPAELLLLIATHLHYPDLLALRHTHPRFLNTTLLATANRIYKVDWLVNRAARGLSIPIKQKLRLDSDAAFCAQPEVREIMRRRRAHAECKAGMGGCVVVEGAECGGARERFEAEGRRKTLEMLDGWREEGRWALAMGMVALLGLVVAVYLAS